MKRTISKIKNKQNKKQSWDLIIKPRSGWLDFHLADLWRYRDLTIMFVKRDLVVTYKQTILGPLWFLIQPLISTLIYTIIFSKVVRIPTDGTPPFLFYLAGTTAWGYFSACITGTSNTFVSNAAIFGKVYFPRMTVPLSIVISSLFRFLIQMAIFILVYLFYYFNGAAVVPNISMLGLPLLILQMGILGLGTGILVSSLVTKYRDLSILMTFAVQLWMYASPVIYPVSQIPEKYRDLFMLNPMASIIEWFRYSFFTMGVIDMNYTLTSWAITIGIFFAGLVFFNRIEKSFMDTV